MFPVAVFLPIYLLVVILRVALSQHKSQDEPTVAESRILFSRVGTSPRFLKYSAIRFDQNITQLEEATQLVFTHLQWHAGNNSNDRWRKEVWERMDSSEEAYNHIAYAFDQTRYETDLHSIQSRLTVLQSRIKAFKYQFRPISDIHREYIHKHPVSFSQLKRQAPTRKTRGLVAIIFGVVGLTVAVTLLTAWISSELTAAPQIATPSYSHLATDVRHLGYTANDTAKVLYLLSKATAKKAQKDYMIKRYDDALIVLERRFDHFTSALSLASMGRLAPTVIMESDYGQLTTQVFAHARDLGLEPAGDFISDWLQFETAFVANDDGFHVLLFVPLFDAEEAMIIHRHRRIPIPLGQQIHLSLDPGDYKYVALNSKHTEFRALTEAEFRSCRQTGGIYICDNQSFVRKAPKTDTIKGKDGATCLFALSTQKYRLAASACRTHLSSAETAIDMVAPTVFALYSDEPTTCIVHCPNRDSPYNLPIQNLSLVTLPPGCSATTKDFAFATADISFSRAPEDWTVSYSWPLALEELTRDMDPDELTEIAKLSKHNMDNQGRLYVNDLLESQRLADLARTGSFTTPIVIILVLLAVIVAACWACKTLRNHRRLSQRPEPTVVFRNDVHTSSSDDRPPQHVYPIYDEPGRNASLMDWMPQKPNAPAQ